MNDGTMEAEARKVVIRPALDLSGLAFTRTAEDLGVSITKSSSKQRYPACFRG